MLCFYASAARNELPPKAISLVRKSAPKHIPAISLLWCQNLSGEQQHSDSVNTGLYIVFPAELIFSGVGGGLFWLVQLLRRVRRLICTFIKDGSQRCAQCRIWTIINIRFFLSWLPTLPSVSKTSSSHRQKLCLYRKHRLSRRVRLTSRVCISVGLMASFISTASAPLTPWERGREKKEEKRRGRRMKDEAHNAKCMKQLIEAQTKT